MPRPGERVRTLPLDDELVIALTLLRKLQMEESAAAVPRIRQGLAALDWYCGGDLKQGGTALARIHKVA
jgi:hypothetical protein